MKFKSAFPISPEGMHRTRGSTALQTTKTLLLSSAYGITIGLGSFISAEERFREPFMPAPNYVGDWGQLDDRFQKWDIARFQFKGDCADGGSEDFEFEASDGTAFDIIIANPAWWTIEDQKRRRQPAFLWFDGKVYRIEEGSEVEAKLREKLSRAAETLEGDGSRHPKYLRRLIDMINAPISRHYDGWPYDRLDVEHTSGDWNAVSGQLEKWKIVKFDEWATTSDGSFVFWFSISKESKFGILLTTLGSNLNPEVHEATNTNADPFNTPDPDPYFPRSVFLLFDKTLYLVERCDRPESRLLEMLELASKSLKGTGSGDPKYLSRLRDAIQGRETDLAWFPMTDAEYYGEKRD